MESRKRSQAEAEHVLGCLADRLEGASAEMLMLVSASFLVIVEFFSLVYIFGSCASER